MRALNFSVEADQCKSSSYGAMLDWFTSGHADEWLQGGTEKVLHPAESVESSDPMALDLPSELQAIAREIEASRSILDLPDNWDDQGSAGYTEAVWMRATDFLMRHAKWLYERHCLSVEAPDIGPGPEGSIDLHWRTDEYELLINIPASPQKPAGFYGDDYGKAVIKGTLDTAGISRGLETWLMTNR